MNTSHADRNLLFGILALQMDFIDRDALVAAMNGWVLQKSKPLAQVLLEQRKLTEDEHKLLEALVQKHLEKHGNDPQMSLAALSSATQIKADLAKIDDPHVTASLQLVPGTPAPDMYHTQPTGVTGASTGLRFQILRPHAKGGLGQVSVAEDTELHREVALKEIQPAHAKDMQSRTRFLLEAEITGGLEHPGIVPVYGLGHYEDGRPFYAMRFIRGDSLKEAVDRFYREARNRSPADSALELRKLIGRLIDVCNAMEYAHSRGVLHRDLKPGNIMLGKYGETLVVDWGLAKAMDQPDSLRLNEEGSLRPHTLSSSAPTVIGLAIGTPQFMSPEQAAGRIQMLGPYSDVYSLGATLYTVLTGKAPFEGPRSKTKKLFSQRTGEKATESHDVGTVLQRVQRGDFDPPRDSNSDIPKPLEAICLKAMALEPLDRYQTPGQLADELEHWLADELITAYSESAAERAYRWLRRHRTWALAAAAALLAITGVSIVAATLINQARVREAIARKDAEEQRNQAEYQRNQAELSFRHAREAVDRFFTQVSETTLLDVPGLQPLRKDLLRVALDYDQEFLTQRGNDSALKQEAAAAYFRIGTVTGEIGSKTEALEYFRKARQTQQDLFVANPKNVDLRAALANTVNAMGGIQQATGDLAEAKKHFDEARQMRETLGQEQPGNDEYQRKLANSYSNLGVIERAEGHAERAIPWYIKANEVRSKLVAKDAKAPLPRRDLARGCYNLGVVQREAGKLDEAARNLKFAIGFYTQLAGDWPLVIEYRRELGVCHKTLGDLLSHMDRFFDAQECYERAREIQQPLAHENPMLVELAADLAGTYIGLGDLKNLQGEAAEARRLHEEAGAILRQLVRDNPQVARFQEDLAAQQLHVGQMRFSAADVDKAKAAFQSALDDYTRLLNVDSQKRSLQDGLARAHINLGMIAREEGALSQAFEHYDLARQAYARLADKSPEDAPTADRLAASLSSLAAIEHVRGNTEAALELYGKAQGIHDRWLDGPAATLEHRQHLAETLYMVGAIRLASDEWLQAAATLERSAELAAGLLINHAKNAGFRSLRADSLHDRGYALWQLERMDEAREAYRQAAAEQRMAFDLKPQDSGRRETFSRYLSDLAAVQRDTGHIDDAAAVCLERRQLWPKDAAELYNVARDLALVAAAVGEGAALSDELRAQREKLADQAVGILSEAARAGFKDWPRAEADEDLNILRDRPAYRELVK